MDKIRKTIKTRKRPALAVDRGDEQKVVEVLVATFANPRNDSAWKRAGQEYCERQDLDFVRFTGEPFAVVDVYEMELLDFLVSATLVDRKERED